MERTVRLEDWDFADMGWDNCQYWPGFGCSFTRFEHCASGCGATAGEAVADLLEDIAQREEFDVIDLDALEADLLAHCGLAAWPDDSYETEDEDDSDDDGIACEIYYYVGLRWNMPEPAPADDPSYVPDVL